MNNLNIKNLKLKIQKILSFLISIAVVVAIFVIFQPQKAVAAGSIYLAPGSATIAKDAYFSVSVRVNSSGVDSIQANLSYPTDKLEFTGLSYGGTGFEIQAEGSGGGGNIKIARGTVSAKSGDVLVATISFRAKVDSGSATVSFVSGTEGVKAGGVVATARSGGTYSFTKPAPPPKPKPKDKTAPKISDLKIAEVGLNKATITWTTAENATSVVEYGPTKNLGITSSSSKSVKSHKVSLSSELLFPGTTYYYQVKSKDAAGNEAKSDLASFKTKGYRAAIKITGSDGQPIVDAKITLIPGGQSAVTNESGVVSFDDLAVGEYSVHVEFGGQVLAGSISVEEVEDAEQTQEFDVQVAAAAKFQLAGEENILPILLAFTLIAILIGSMVWWTRKHPLHFLHKELGGSKKAHPSKGEKKPKEIEDKKKEEDD